MLRFIDRNEAHAGSPQERSQAEDWLQLIRGEYEELPGLQLTQAQAEERWALDARSAEALLDDLVSSGVLRMTGEGAYVRADAS